MCDSVVCPADTGEYTRGDRDFPWTKTGNTDLFAELPGKFNIRMRIKHFYPDHGKLQDDVVDQLADSMDPGDHGISVTSGATFGITQVIGFPRRR